MSNNPGIVVHLDTGEMDRIVRDLHVREEQVIRRLAFEIERAAKQNAPVDTGALRSSIYTITENYSGRGRAEDRAFKKNKAIIDLVEIPEPGGNVFARVGPCVEYGEYVEFGTYRMGAQPYLTPAAEQVEGKFNSGDTWRELFERGR